MKKSIKLIGEDIFFQAVIILLVITVLMGMVGCEKSKPIRVGFVGGLTGRLSDLGIAGRNGVILAVEETNKAGGINRRPLELITKDDKQDPKMAVKVDKELINEGVVAIIGHMTSAMSIAAVPLINKEKILMISPTTSTNKLTGIDDYFLRVTPPNKAETDHLARHAFKGMNLQKIAAVYDLSNRAYTEGFFNNFKSEYENMGGEVIQAETFTSGLEVSFTNLAKALLEPDPDGLLIVAGALDTAMICQHIRKTGSKAFIISCGWAMTGDFLQHGGPAVEGVVFSHPLDKENPHKAYLEFKDRFGERFGHEPNFAAAKGYEAARILLEGLTKSDDPNKLKATILEQEVFHGIHGNFKMDKYGDPQRKLFLITVKNGQLRTLE